MHKLQARRIGFILVASAVLLSGCGSNSKPDVSQEEPIQTAPQEEKPGTNAPGTAQGGQSGQNDQSGQGNQAGEGTANNGNGNAVQNGAANGQAAEEGGSASDQAQSQLADTVASMTLEEKIGQLIIAGVDGTSADRQAKRMVEDQHVGSIIFYKNNLDSVAGMTKYVNQLRAWNKDNKAPLMLSVDQEGGKVSRLPGLTKLPNARQIGDTDRPELAEEVGRILAEACAAMGINVDYAPVLDINSNPDNPVIGVRSFGTSAERVSEMGLAAMKGIAEKGIVPVVKHFPGHGDTGVDSHLELPVVQKSLPQLQSFEWKPFEAAIEQGADAVMVAHILFPKIDAKYPASLSKTIITDQLRGTLHFDGVVMTDDLTMGAIKDHYGIGEAAVQSMKAGSDMLLVAHDYANIDAVIAALKQAVGSGELTEERLNESVLRVMTLKQTYKFTDAQIAKADVSALNDEIAGVLKEAGLK